jgi:hypothetical protein
MKQVQMTVQIRRLKESKVRTKIGFLLLGLCRKVTGWQMEIKFLSPGDEANRSARRRAVRRNAR